MTLKVKGEGLGAQVTGVDPKNLDDITTDEIRDIVYTNKLVVLKDVHPSPREFIKLGRIIGQIVPYYEPMYHHEDHPEIFVSSTEEGQGVPKTGAFWHIDYMFMPEPFAFSMVLPLAVPGHDRGTYFIDLARVWQSLPAAKRDPARGTVSTHDPRRHIKIRPSDVYRPIGEVWDEINRIAVLVLDLGGARRADVEDLLAATGQLDPEYQSPFIHTQHYQVGDIILWDNRVLMHRAKHGSAAGTLTTYRLTMLDGLKTPGYAA